MDTKHPTNQYHHLKSVLNGQESLIQSLEEELSSLQSEPVGHDQWSNTLDLLYDFQTQIDELDDKITQLENNKLILRNKVNWLKQQECDLSKLMKLITTPTTPPLSSATMSSPIIDVHPNMMTKAPFQATSRNKNSNFSDTFQKSSYNAKAQLGTYGQVHSHHTIGYHNHTQSHSSHSLHSLHHANNIHYPHKPAPFSPHANILPKTMYPGTTCAISPRKTKSLFHDPKNDNKNEIIENETFNKQLPIDCFILNGWKFESITKKMANGKQLQYITNLIGLKHLPEMVFADSLLNIQYIGNQNNNNNKSNETKYLNMNWNAIDGLKPCVGEPIDPVQVQYASEWKKHTNPPTDIEELKIDHDWTFTTNYKGTYSLININDSDIVKCKDKFDKLSKLNPIIENTKEGLNIKLLKDTNEPILWHSQDVLFEDELSDSGLCQLMIRSRVMPKCFLVLCRCWMRCDNVILRVYDTRIYHEFGNNYIIRNYQQRQIRWNQLLKNGKSTDCADYTDPNRFANDIPIVKETFEKIHLTQ